MAVLCHRPHVSKLQNFYVDLIKNCCNGNCTFQQLKPELQEVKKQINDVYKFMNGVSTYGIDKLLEIVHKVNNMSEEDKKLMSDLINLNRVK